MTGSDEEFQREARSLLGSGTKMKFLPDQVGCPPANARCRLRISPVRAIARLNFWGRAAWVQCGWRRIPFCSVPVALKILAAENSSADLAARLMQEAVVLARLEHPGIVPVHDAGTLPDGRTFYCMKHVEGQTLDQLRRHNCLCANDCYCSSASLSRWPLRIRAASFIATSSQPTSWLALSVRC